MTTAFPDFRRFTDPIIAGLRSLGIPAEFSGRNGLTNDGKKFSGNDQCRFGSKTLHHGTLMYEADTGELAKALKVRNIKLRSKGSSSVKSRVPNISGHMERPMELEAFRARLFNKALNSTPKARRFTPSRPEDLNSSEPEHVAQAAYEMGLRHVVLTSVTCDDLPDGGAAHFVATVRALYGKLPDATVRSPDS